MGATRRGEGGAGRGRQFVALCALVLALWVGHQFLMTSERHATVMDLTHGWAGLASTAASEGTPTGHAAGLGQEQMPGRPMPLVDDCPVEWAVVPLLLLLVSLIGNTVGWRAVLGAARAAGRLPVCSLPPPLPPARRRALLQVFRI